MDKGMLVLLLLLLVVIYYSYSMTEVTTEKIIVPIRDYYPYSYYRPHRHYHRRSRNNNRLIGGNKREDGCLASAGYSWDPVQETCIQNWPGGDGYIYGNK